MDRGSDTRSGLGQDSIFRLRKVLVRKMYENVQFSEPRLQEVSAEGVSSSYGLGSKLH